MMMDELLDLDNPNLTHFTTQRRSFPFLSCTMEIYSKRVIGPSCRQYFEFYRNRLKRYGAPAERSAIAILREIANAPGGRVSDSVLYDVYRKTRRKGASDMEFLEIMADLECDWYVSLDTATNEYFFLIDIVKDWWKRFYRSLSTKRR